MGNWSVTKRIPGRSGRAVVVSARRTRLRLASIQFATPQHGRDDLFHYLYQSSNTHGIAPGDLQWWARGGKITVPEWADNGRRNWRACFTRNETVAMVVRFAATTTADLTCRLRVEPLLDGSSSRLQPASVDFTYPANSSEHAINVVLGGALPDEVGRYKLVLNWSVTGTGFEFAGPRVTQHRIYSIYGQPLEPEYDSASVGDTGTVVPRSDGTLTGTRRRFDHLMRLIGGSDMRCPVASHTDLVNLYWNLHKGINDTPGAPPYFDAGHDMHITNDGTGDGTDIPVEDQWLAWVRNSTQWNDASCIGHVQIAKTMLAAIGLFARRTWVFPHTTRLPDGSTTSFADEDLYCLGTFDSSKEQSWTFRHNGRNYVANPKLMEPGVAWENFEACMKSPDGRFLTGGYATSSNPPSFRANKGFASAAELLSWWANTSRSGFGKRFQCWVYYRRATNEGHCWDVEGRHYDLGDYVQVRTRGKELPPPTP